MTDSSSSVDINFLRRQLEQEKAKNALHLKSGGGGGTFDGMEARVSKLESLAEDTRGTLESIQRQLARMDERLQNMPTTEKVYTAIFTVYGLSFTIIAAAAGIFALMR